MCRQSICHQASVAPFASSPLESLRTLVTPMVKTNAPASWEKPLGKSAFQQPWVLASFIESWGGPYFSSFFHQLYPWCWNIYLHDWVIWFGQILANIPYMEHMGDRCSPQHWITSGYTFAREQKTTESLECGCETLGSSNQLLFSQGQLGTMNTYMNSIEQLQLHIVPSLHHWISLVAQVTGSPPPRRSFRPLCCSTTSGTPDSELGRQG